MFAIQYNNVDERFNILRVLPNIYYLLKEELKALTANDLARRAVLIFIGGNDF